MRSLVQVQSSRPSLHKLNISWLQYTHVENGPYIYLSHKANHPQSLVPEGYDRGSIEDEAIFSFFEAARWAPSSSNNQLTRFIYTKRDSENWNDFFNLLTEGNQNWCKNAAALVIVISRTHAYYKDRKQRTHSFEAGAAVENLMIEATSQGYVAHAMGGFDQEKAHEYLQLSDLWKVEVMISIGIFDLETSKLKEEKASNRKPFNDITFKDQLPQDFE